MYRLGIGNTPLRPIDNLASLKMRLYAKLEYRPLGKADHLSSLKDRAAFYMISDAKNNGYLDGKIVLEPTSGNTGIALARLSGVMGYKTELIVPDKTSEETKEILRDLGKRSSVKVLETPDDLCPRVGGGTEQALALANAMINNHPGMYYMPNQYVNDANFRAHYETTGPEIWKQTDGKVTHVFLGGGTGGTYSGIETYLKEQNPNIKVIVIEPQRHHHIQGLRNFEDSAVPDVMKRHFERMGTSIEAKKAIGEWLTVSDTEAYDTHHELYTKEGLFPGVSSGAVMAGALRVAEKEDGVGVMIFADSGFKYRSLTTDKWISNK